MEMCIFPIPTLGGFALFYERVRLGSTRRDGVKGQEKINLTVLTGL